VLCGSDPLTGQSWEPAGGAEAIVALIERVRQEESFDTLSLGELERLVHFHAYCVGAAEARATSLAGQGKRRIDPRTWLGGDRRRQRDFNEAEAVLLHNVNGLRWPSAS